ncbi:hypothetical protein PGIGA_G00228610 [Pangasianodon gigas]|uniref:Uncharacterized protein n=1 Tax=Pangasianodon gigas TaxID=30993 RepID=A0ACC5WK96_PANGG|nr:hypothetical protein [Pangasianodon gigas]
MLQAKFEALEGVYAHHSASVSCYTHSSAAERSGLGRGPHVCYLSVHVHGHARLPLGAI